jgi:heme uptake protein IsdC
MEEESIVKKSRLLQSLLITVLCILTLLIMPKAEAASDLADGTYTLSYTITKAENDSVSMANDYFEKPATLFVKNGQIDMQIAINHSKWVTQFKVPDKASFVDAKIISSDSAADKRVVRFQVNDLSKPIISKIHVTVESIDYDHDYTIRFVVDEKSIKNTASGTSTAPKATAPEVSAPSEAAPAAVPKTAPAEAPAAAPGTSSSAAANIAAAPKPATEPPKPAAAAKSTAAPTPVKEVNSTSAAAITAHAGASVDSSTIANPKTGDTTPVALLVVLMALSALYLRYSLKVKRSEK